MMILFPVCYKFFTVLLELFKNSIPLMYSTIFTYESEHQTVPSSKFILAQDPIN